MALLPCEPRRSLFDKLTIDIVEHIFLKGCETNIPESVFDTPAPVFVVRKYTGGIYRDGPISRRLKSFALNVRGVCSKWKRLIDSEESFGFTRYWFARLVLIVPSYDHGPNKVSLAKQMLRFHTQLVNSRGCDLDILLASSSTLKNWDDSMDLYSETGAMLKLLTYAIVGLKKYCKQIVNITVDSDEPHVLLNAIDLLSMIPRQGSRLSRLGLPSPTPPTVTETLLRMDLKGIWRRSGVQPCASPLLNLSHLTNLGTLFVGKCSQLSEELHLPSGVRTQIGRAHV